MPDVALPLDLGSTIAELERRIRILETAPRANDTTLPWVVDTIDATFTTSSLTAVDSSPPNPVVTMTVGQTGRVLVTASAYIGLNNANMTGFAYLYIDGIAISEIIGLSNFASAIAANVSSTRVISVTPGEHTFVLKYLVSSGTGNFSSRSLIVQPF